MLGCGNEPAETFNTVDEAQNYASNNPGMGDKIFIKQPDGTKISLSQWNSNQWQKEHTAEIEANKAKAQAKIAAKTNSGDTSFSVDTGDTSLIELFQNGNPMEVFSGGTLTKITLDKPVKLKELTTYHWNDGKGKSPVGTVEILDQSGKSLGSWTGTGSDGQGGVIDANWIFSPDISLPAGSYTIKDSDPSTWSQNSGTGGMGMIWVKGFFE